MLTEPLLAIIGQRVGQTMTASDVCLTQLSGTHQVWQCAFEVNGVTQRLIVKQLHAHDGQAFSFASTFALQQQLYAMGRAAEPIYLGQRSVSHLLSKESSESRESSVSVENSVDEPAPQSDLLWVEAFVPEFAMKGRDGAAPSTLARALAHIHQTANCATRPSKKPVAGPSLSPRPGPSSSPRPGLSPSLTAIRQLDPIKQCQALIHAVHTLSEPNTSSTAQALSQQLELLLNDMQQLKQQKKPQLQAPNKDWDERVFCHNDLHLSHIRADYTCVDWEYAALGPRYFDLAMCIVINQLSPTAQTQLLKEYAQLTHKNIHDVTQRTALYVRLALIINQAWALLV